MTSESSLFKTLYKILLIIIGLAVTLNGTVLTFTTNFNLGNVLTLVLGIGFLLCGALSGRIQKAPKLIKLLFSAALILVLVLSTFLLGFGTVDNVTYKEDAIIVLGAAVKGDTPSLVLREA